MSDILKSRIIQLFNIENNSTEHFMHLGTASFRLNFGLYFVLNLAYLLLDLCIFLVVLGDSFWG